MSESGILITGCDTKAQGSSFDDRLLQIVDLKFGGGGGGGG